MPKGRPPPSSPFSLRPQGRPDRWRTRRGNPRSGEDTHLPPTQNRRPGRSSSSSSRSFKEPTSALPLLPGQAEVSLRVRAGAKSLPARNSGACCGFGFGCREERDGEEDRLPQTFLPLGAFPSPVACLLGSAAGSSHVTCRTETCFARGDNNRWAHRGRVLGEEQPPEGAE